LIEDADLVQLPVANVNESRDIPAKIEQRVQPDRSWSIGNAPKEIPTEHKSMAVASSA
jgi:hypothetical protein